MARDADTASVNWWLWRRWPWQFRVYDGALDPALRREWAAVCLVVTDAMLIHADRDPWTAASDTAHLRAFVIHNLGEVPGSGAWEAAVLVRDVLARFTLDVEQASRLAAEWRSLPRAQILELSRHKSLLGAVALIADAVPEPERAVLDKWLAIRGTLP